MPSTQISVLEDRWYSYEFKINLLIIVSDNSLPDDKKIERISACKEPFMQDRHHQTRLQLAKSCNRFKRNMSALVLYDTDPEAAYKFFHGLYLDVKSVYYSGNRLASKIACLDKNESAEKTAYKIALNEWLSSIDESDIPSFEFNFVRNWLYCLIKNNDHRGVDAL